MDDRYPWKYVPHVYNEWMNECMKERTNEQTNKQKNCVLHYLNFIKIFDPKSGQWNKVRKSFICLPDEDCLSSDNNFCCLNLTSSAKGDAHGGMFILILSRSVRWCSRCAGVRWSRLTPEGVVGVCTGIGRWIGTVPMGAGPSRMSMLLGRPFGVRCDDDAPSSLTSNPVDLTPIPVWYDLAFLMLGNRAGERVGGFGGFPRITVFLSWVLVLLALLLLSVSDNNKLSSSSAQLSKRPSVDADLEPVNLPTEPLKADLRNLGSDLDLRIDVLKS